MNNVKGKGVKMKEREGHKESENVLVLDDGGKAITQVIKFQRTHADSILAHDFFTKIVATS